MNKYLLILFLGIFTFTLSACGAEVNNVSSDVESEQNDLQVSEIKVFDGTNSEVFNFTDAIQVPSEFNPNKREIVYEDDNYKIYDMTDFGYIQSLDLVKSQSFEFVVECSNTSSCQLNNQNFVYQVGNDFYFSTLFATTQSGFLNNENYQFITFEVLIPDGKQLDNIYFNNNSLYKLESDNISTKIANTNSQTPTTETNGDVSTTTKGDTRI